MNLKSEFSAKQNFYQEQIEKLEQKVIEKEKIIHGLELFMKNKLVNSGKRFSFF